ncbi:right-handed parallel beta-helix repeat-containing protein, partial [Candidatus Sumerlaeota bacterium]|nr:right-handed parallel beta-helix repeat-containing protein [Candidatus Sumerlaeota bacterium]
VAPGVTSGIAIRADDVVIDLAGYTLSGPGSGLSAAVSAEATTRAEVRNGAVRDFGYIGIYLGPQGTAENLQIENCAAGLALSAGGSARRVHITGSELIGIQTVGGAEIIDCSVSDCAAGIVLFLGSTVTRCSVWGSDSFGFLSLGPVIYRDCTVIGAVEEGFSGQSGAVFENCTALAAGTGFEGENGVTIRNCTARLCSVEGIAVSGSVGSSLVADCHVENAPIGIRVEQPAMINGNFINNASTSGIQMGATTTDVALLDNVVMNAASAIHHLGTGANCFYARNTYTGGVVLGANATWGPLVIGVNNVDDDAGGDSPWANIQH